MVYNNFPTNNERIPCPYSQIRENTIKNEYISLLLGPSDIKNEYQIKQIYKACRAPE